MSDFRSDAQIQADDEKDSAAAERDAERRQRRVERMAGWEPNNHGAPAPTMTPQERAAKDAKDNDELIHAQARHKDQLRFPEPPKLPIGPRPISAEGSVNREFERLWAVIADLRREIDALNGKAE